jgi:hypothetical protein
MTVSEPPGSLPPGDDTALLTAALNHAWAWYDARSNRANQAVNFYIVATAIVITAYATSINEKHYGFASALAIAALELTGIAAAAARYEVRAAGRAEPAFAEMQERIGGRLKTDSMRIASREPRLRLRLTALAIIFGLPTAFEIFALIYAVTR